MLSNFIILELREMNVVDCYWERENLNRKAIEIELGNSDIITCHDIEELSRGYEYVVTKVPVNRVDLNFLLSSMGFVMIESQMTISKSYKDFNFNDRLISHIYNDVDFFEVLTDTEFEKMLKNITPNMFSTDRIYLDPEFGPDVSCKRYKNWLCSSFPKKDCNFYEYAYRGDKVGFTMYRDEKKYWRGLLGGVYEKYQNEGLGILTATSFFLYAKKRNIPMKKLIGAISSNNIPMVSIYNYLDFKLISNDYVFIKHQNSQN